MEPLDRQKARRIFIEVADLPEADRAAALERMCGGDASLRAEVEALLSAVNAGFFFSGGVRRSLEGSSHSSQAGRQRRGVFLARPRFPLKSFRHQ
jgi:hypothetical protein